MAKPLTKYWILSGNEFYYSWIPEGKNWTYTKEKAKSKYIDREIFTLPNTLILIAYDPTQRPQLG